MTVHSVEGLFNPDQDDEIDVYLHGDVIDFVKRIETMRTHQKNYFSTRSKRDLRLAKGAERRLDEEIKSILTPEL